MFFNTWNVLNGILPFIVCVSHYLCKHHHSCENKITPSMWTSQSACINHTRAFINHSLRSKISLVRVSITLCVWTSPYACEHHTMRVNITLCVWISHYACEHHTMRVNITRCVWISHYACEHHNMRVNILHKSDFYTQSVVLTRMSVFFECHNHTHTCQHRTLRV
jgi:hypothetical protein